MTNKLVIARQMSAEQLYHSATRLVAEGHLDDAERYFHESLDIIAENPPSLSGLGDLLVKTGRRTEALKYYRRVFGVESPYVNGLFESPIPASPPSPESIMRYAEVCESFGLKDETDHAYDLVLTTIRVRWEKIKKWEEVTIQKSPKQKAELAMHKLSDYIHKSLAGPHPFHPKLYPPNQ